MTIKCPICESPRIITRDYGRKTCGTIGTVAGAASGAAAAATGARLGATIGAIAGPAGSVAGAIIGGLFGGVAGGTAGAEAGKLIDQHVLDNFECIACGHCFSRDED